MLLDAGAPLMAETVDSTMPEPDNTASVSYMNVQISRFLDAPTITLKNAEDLDTYNYELE